MGRHRTQSTIDRMAKSLEWQMNGHPNDPTPEQIAERTAEIRAEWDEFTRASRLVNKVKPVEVHRVRHSGGVSGIDFG